VCAQGPPLWYSWDNDTQDTALCQRRDGASVNSRLGSTLAGAPGRSDRSDWALAPAMAKKATSYTDRVTDRVNRIGTSG
jgi:hypothetical protein